MDAGDVVIQKIVTLFQSEVNTYASHAFRIIFASPQSTQKLGWKARATGQLRDASEPAHGCDRHDARDYRNMNVGQRATLTKIKEVPIIEKQLGDDVVRARVDLRLEVIHFEQSIRGRGMSFRETG